MSSFWTIALSSGGLVAFISALIQGLFNRRRESAETTAIIQKASAAAVDRTEKENKELRTRMHKIESRFDQLRCDVRERDDRIDELIDDIKELKNQLDDRDKQISRLSSSLENVQIKLDIRDKQVTHLSEELDDFRSYTIYLWDVLQRQNLGIELRVPPAHIARHFPSGRSS